MHEGSQGAARDGGRERPKVSQGARSRRFLSDRLASSRHYADFAAASGADIFDGEPIECFAAVGKLDERTLRMRAQELREEIFVEEFRQGQRQLGGGRAAQVAG